MNIDELRECFPALSTTVYGKGLVYLDSAATSQRPRSVVDKWNEYMKDVMTMEMDPETGAQPKLTQVFFME